MAFAPLSKPQSKAQGPARPVLQRKVAGGLLQRKCACGGRCEDCGNKKSFGLQTKLKVSEAGDQYEQEADRVADRVMAAQADPSVSNAPPRIQRNARQPAGQAEAAPASVGRALAGPGRSLEPVLRRDMEQRFGYDFSRVRVHSDRTAGESARDVNAHAYTVGHDIVFSAGQFVPGTHEGRRLIAHELTHVVQQTGNVLAPTASVGSSRALLQRAPDEKKPGTESEPLNSPYLEEMDILGYAVRVMGPSRFAPGVVFYVTGYQKATAISSNAFVVGPFSSDIEPLFFYVYRLKSSNEKKGTSTFTRGIYSGGWSGDKIPPDLYEKLAKVEGRTELEVKATSQTVTDPRDSLAFMMTVWSASGQLDPARLPQGVAAIPPLPITQEQHKQLKTDLSGPTAVAMIGVLKVVQSTGTAAQTAITSTSAGATATTFARGTGTLVAVTEEAAAGAAVESGTSTVAGRAATAARAGTAATAAGVTVFFWPREAGRGSTSRTSDITGQPYEGPGQREWEGRLTPEQKDYFKRQWRQRYGPPGPVPVESLEPTPTPTKQTEPEPQRRRRRRRCDRPKGQCPSWQPRLTRPNTYWNHAYEYRRDKNMLSQYDFNQNVAVLLLEDEEPIVEKNEGGLHSEQQIIWKLTERGIDSDCPILGLFSERMPCQKICQKDVLPQLCRINNGAPFGVFFAINYYNSSEGIKTDNHRHDLIKSYHQAGYRF